jgi:ubiquinone/menaquinone biosynthesis C-methylase UbiE
MQGHPSAFQRERERTRRFFNRIAAIFPIIEGWLAPSYRLALAQLALPTHLTVLDLGTGSGELAAALAARGHPVTGIDTAERLLRRAARRLPGVTFKTMDLVDLPVLAAASFDLVTLAHVLHGVPAALRQLALAEAGRIARRGVVVIDYADKLPFYLRLAEWLEGPHYRTYARASLPELAAAATLEVERAVKLPGASACWLLRRRRDSALRSAAEECYEAGAGGCDAGHQSGHR